jgi:hypothetical protein
MPSTEQIRENYAKSAVVERLWSYTVGIANRAVTALGTDPQSGLPAREEESPGTGVAGKWGKHQFILTARHVLEGAETSDLTFFARPTGTFKHAPSVTMGDALAAVPIRDESAFIYRSEAEDLALITMGQSTLGPYLEFVDLGEALADPSENETVFGLGFPVSSATVFGRQVGNNLEKAVLLSPIAFSGDVLPAAMGRYFSDFDPDRHFLIPYEMAAEGKHPRGISGAAVWIPSQERQVVWSARIRFAGICTSCYRDGSIEQVVKASVVREFLEETFSEESA